jgi:hypothetical protein
MMGKHISYVLCGMKNGMQGSLIQSVCDTIYTAFFPTAHKWDLSNEYLK